MIAPATNLESLCGTKKTENKLEEKLFVKIVVFDVKHHLDFSTNNILNSIFFQKPDSFSFEFLSLMGGQLHPLYRRRGACVISVIYSKSIVTGRIKKSKVCCNVLSDALQFLLKNVHYVL